MTKAELIEKFDSECEKSPLNYTLRVICEHMIDYLHKHEGEADKIDSKKTLAGAVDAMRNEARKRASGNCGVLTDAEGFEIVHKYFGVDAIDDAEPETEKPQKPVRKVVSLFGTR